MCVAVPGFSDSIGLMALNRWSHALLAKEVKQSQQKEKRLMGKVQRVTAVTRHHRVGNP